jgi:ankyrin repeat protein
MKNNELRVRVNRISILFLVIFIVGLFTSCSYSNKNLVGALKSGNLERVKEAVDNGADVNKVSFLFGPDASPLLYSMRNGQECIPEYLLSKGADPNYIDSDGISILMYTVGALKERGLNYGNVTDNENYKTLLNDKRTNINLTGKLGYTALDYACRDMGDLTIVEFLISNGAKITSTTMKCAIEGFSQGSCEASVIKVIFDSLTQQGIPYGIDPDIVAAIQGDTDKLRSFVKSGEIKEENRQMVMFLCAAFGDINMLQIFAGQNIDLDEKFNRDTLLGIACSYGKLETVKYLVSKNADLETAVHQIGSVHEETILTKAIRHNRIDVVEYLLKSGAKFHTFDDTTQENDLEIACENGNLNLVKLIIEQGYPITDDQLLRAMAAAALNDHIRILEYFLTDVKANINGESSFFEETVLGIAARKASLNTIQYLVNHGADVNGGKARVMTPLDRAVNSNRLDLVKYLIDSGADVNVIGVYSNGGGKTDRLLTQAVQRGYFDMVKLLVENGADINYKEEWFDEKETILDVARKRGSQNIIDYLVNVQKKK